MITPMIQMISVGNKQQPELVAVCKERGIYLSPY